MLDAVHQLVVELIRDDDQVMFFGDTGNLQQDFARVDRTGGVVGITQQDGLGARGDGGFYPFGFHLETVFDEGGDLHRHATSEDYLSLVGDETRCGDDDLFTGVEQGGHGQVESFGNPDGDDGFRLGVILNPIQFDKCDQ